MAIDPKTKYVGRIDTSDLVGYPLGKCRNETVPAANDGTPNDQDWLNDFWGFYQALLAAAAIAPSGSPDKVGASQYLAALQTLFADIADGRFPTTDEKAAMTAAATPDAGNAFVTADDITTLPSSNQKAALEGTDGTPSVANKYVTDSDSRLVAGVEETMIVQDQKAVGVNGQALSATTQNIRNLTTVVVNSIPGASLNSNQVTLPEGTYDVFAKAKERNNSFLGSGFSGGLNFISIYDTTGVAYLVHDGRASFGFFSEPVMDGWQTLTNRFTIGASSVLELRHYTERANSGGHAINVTSFLEIFATVVFKRVS